MAKLSETMDVFRDADVLIHDVDFLVRRSDGVAGYEDHDGVKEWSSLDFTEERMMALRKGIGVVRKHVYDQDTLLVENARTICELEILVEDYNAKVTMYEGMIRRRNARRKVDGTV